MAQLVADVLLARLREWGVRQVFGYPGDGINGLLAAWGRAEDDPQFVQARHEEMAAFEAVGYAKFTGQVGVCVATSGPGRDPPAQRAVRREARPRAGGGDRRADRRGRRWAAPTSRRSTCCSLFKDVCSDYVQMCTVPEQLPNLIDRAIRIALAEQRPDRDHHPVRRVQDLEYEPPGHAFKMVPSSVGIDWPDRRARTPTRCGRAADLLNAGEKVAMLVGQGARGCADGARPRSPTCSAPGVAKALLGKDVLSDDAAVGHRLDRAAGHPASYEMMMDCDTLLTVGLELPLHPVPARARTRPGRSRSTSTGKLIGMRYPYEVNLVGDAKATLRALIPLLQRKTDRAWRERHRGRRRATGGRPCERRGDDRRRPGQPDADLPRAVPAAARRTRSSPPTPASSANWYARHLKFRGDMRGSLSGHAGHHGPRGAVRDRRQVRRTRTGRRSRSSATARCR